jgi:hypothetical protein
MSIRRPGSLFAHCAGLAAFAAVAAVCIRAPRAMSPCKPEDVATFSGSLIEVRQGDTIVPSEQAILDGLPRRLCVSGPAAGPSGGFVMVTDCDFAEYAVSVSLAP